MANPKQPKRADTVGAPSASSISSSDAPASKDASAKPKRNRPSRNAVTIGAGRPCATCVHDRRVEIEQWIIDGVPFSKIARAIGGSPCREAIIRHSSVCIPALFEERRALENARGTFSIDMITQHIARAIERADDAAACAHDSEDESAAGKAAATKAHVDAIKLAGMTLGIFEKKTKVEILMKDPEVQAIFDRLVKVVCAPCAKVCLGVLAGEALDDDADDVDADDDDDEPRFDS